MLTNATNVGALYVYKHIEIKKLESKTIIYLRGAYISSCQNQCV